MQWLLFLFVSVDDKDPVHTSPVCLKTKHPTVGQTDGNISVVKQKLIRVDRAKTHSLITPLMGGKWHEVLSEGGFPLLRNFYVGTHVNFARVN